MIHFRFIFFFSDVSEEAVEIWDRDKKNRAVANVSKKQMEFKKAKKCSLFPIYILGSMST
jgi:hypothetical protein